MSIITDVDWIIQQVRIEYLRAEDQIAERIINFAQTGTSELISAAPTNLPTAPQPQIVGNYLVDEVPERTLCYSPNIPTTTTEISTTKLRSKPAAPAPGTGSTKNLIFATSKDELAPNAAVVGAEKEKAAEATAGSAQTTADKKLKQPPSTASLAETLFRRVDPKPSQLSKPASTLTNKIRSGSELSNPFAKGYSFVCGKGDPTPITLKIYIPVSTTPKKPLVIVVKRDATVEEVIGYALYVFVDEKRTPVIDDKSRHKTVDTWNLRIVEDDGDIDEDFPALERTRKIQKFAFDQFALCPIPASHRKPSGNVKQMVEHITSSSSISASTTATTPTTPKKSAGNIFVKVHLYSTLEVKQTTTVSLPGDMLLSEVLVVCCRKRKIDPNDYTLKMADTKTDIPHDKTLESLGLTELCLLKKDRGPSAGDVFLRPPEEGEQDVDYVIPPQITDEYTSVYKKYTVYKKLSMIMSRQERVLAIDGDYIYIMPPETKNLFDTVRTTSFHASSVISCKQVKKMAPLFRISCVKDRDNKTYEFEAATAQEANEICTRISFMSQLSKSAK